MIICTLFIRIVTTSSSPEISLGDFLSLLENFKKGMRMGLFLRYNYEEKSFIDSLIEGDIKKLDDKSAYQLKKIIEELLRIIRSNEQ